MWFPPSVRTGNKPLKLLEHPKRRNPKGLALTGNQQPSPNIGKVQRLKRRLLYIITKYDILMIMKDREKKNKYQREYRIKNDNLCTNKYEKTINGFLMRKYRNMESRVKGIQKLKNHLYKGLDLLDRKQYYQWAKSSKTFKYLFKTWIENDYDRKFCPTVDRINSLKGYHLSNMEWITHSENSRRGALSARRRYSPLLRKTVS